MPLNPSQEKAVTGSGFQLVLAGPGSGKTKVIIEKILHLLDRGISPTNILALTFSEKAAAEMSERIEALRPHQDIGIHTFHSFCLDMLRENMLTSGISIANGIISRTNVLVWGLRNIDSFGFEYIRIGNNSSEIITAIIDGISAFRDELITPAMLDEYLKRKQQTDVTDEERDYQNKLADLLKVYKAYEQYKQDEHLIDFDDMIFLAVSLLQTNPGIRSLYQNRFPYILVDEFQDTNFAQLELVKLLAGDHLCVVGDDDQTIYRFRGAYLTNIRDFREWAKEHAEVLLDENYRNPPAVLQLAFQLMQRAPNRQQKELISKKQAGERVVVAACGNEEGEGEFVATEIERLVGTLLPARGGEPSRPLRYRDCAILSRSRKDGAKFQAALKRHNIPCIYQADVDFLRLPVIRDMIAYLQIINNPLIAGIALNRIMKLCSIPETVVQAINTGARRRAGDGRSDPDPGNDCVYETMLDAETVLPGHATRISEIIGMLRQFIEEKERQTLPALVHTVMMQASGLYRSALRDEVAMTRQYLARFLEITQEYDQITRDATIGGFIEYLQYFSGFSVEIEEQEETDCVRILTIHKSKGKEFPVVFVADLAQRKFPLTYREKQFVVPPDLAKGLRAGEEEKALFIQEERRLLYVAMTRAEERLYLTYAKWYGKNKRETKPSAFLEELSFRENPLITLVEPAAWNMDLPFPEETPAGEARTRLQEQAIRAIAEMRLSTALQDLVTLERVRGYSEEGREEFDRDAFVSAASTETPITEIIGRPPEQAVIPGTMAFSYSKLQQYNECPLQFRFRHILKIAEPPGPAPAAAKGTGIHAVIENLDPDRPADEQIEELLEEHWTPDQFESKTQAEQNKASARDLLRTYIEWQKENANTIIAPEKRFGFTFAGREIHGFIDRIEQTPDGGYVVIDFKSGKTPSNMTKKNIPENIQLNLYAMAIRELYGELPERASLFYLADNRIIDYLPTEESIRAFTEHLEEMLDNIQSGEFPARPDYQRCQWCPYGDLCEREEENERGM
ncbi:MAG: UvrD/REP helicase [Methanomicrobiales archaeon 53_19]|uniref:ATP-dependent helicase n=1 Tax=Methanocalculus sp. TaxID=2004547 RepID=UPI000749A379|nr:ATP-dependent DNA helicase [Methanocalculus sp.]KUK69703.1 MAG: UvrD/REP helicase [Methanocalculus sp. 52_23]KUL04206.1 MAG: UvrD/REP helicase [Methanomicrobiales archaeon 53_19]HIJ07568.1 ATP-dependent helicase [Methanocalculus sp.]